MSARRTEGPVSISEAVASEISTVTDANALNEGATISLTSPENPLERRLAISIRASINELCLNSSKGTWSPSPEALKSIFQSKKFTSLNGASEGQGDLKSIVLHSMSVNHVSSTFPIALGAKVTGVDDATFSSTGQAFSHVVMPKMESTATRVIQQDDTALAYEFSKKFPGVYEHRSSIQDISTLLTPKLLIMAVHLGEPWLSRRAQRRGAALRARVGRPPPRVGHFRLEMLDL
jgi:hypothetical protein